MPNGSVPDEAALGLEPAVLTSGAELILDALDPFHAGTRVLEVQAGRGVLSRGLKERAAKASAVVVLADARASLLVEGAGDELVVADPRALPFSDATFEHVVANVVLGRRTADAAMLPELARVLRPYGRLTATLLLEGSFTELLDLLLEASEQEDLHEVGAAIRQARAELCDMGTAARVLADSGFDVTRSGVCEHVLWFEDGASALASPLGRGAFLSVLTPLGERLPDVPPSALARVRDAIDTYFGAEGLSVTVRTAVVCCEVASKEVQFSGILAPPEGA